MLQKSLSDDHMYTSFECKIDVLSGQDHATYITTLNLHHTQSAIVEHSYKIISPLTPCTRLSTN